MSTFGEYKYSCGTPVSGDGFGCNDIVRVHAQGEHFGKIAQVCSTVGGALNLLCALDRGFKAMLRFEDGTVHGWYDWDQLECVIADPPPITKYIFKDIVDTPKWGIVNIHNEYWAQRLDKTFGFVHDRHPANLYYFETMHYAPIGFHGVNHNAESEYENVTENGRWVPVEIQTIRQVAVPDVGEKPNFARGRETAIGPTDGDCSYRPHKPLNLPHIHFLPTFKTGHFRNKGN